MHPRAEGRTQLDINRLSGLSCKPQVEETRGTDLALWGAASHAVVAGLVDWQILNRNINTELDKMI